MSSNSKKIALLSAGGTGGHVFPALALAQDLVKRGYKIVFVTDDRGVKYKKEIEGVEYKIVSSGTPNRSGIFAKIAGVIKLGLGILKAYSVLKKVQPSVVVGFGGYPSVPPVWVAQRLKIKTILHEQNAVMGKANQFLADKAQRIALSIPVKEGLSDAHKIKSVVTGNPVREDIVELYSEPYQPPQPETKCHILVVGGSLGATIFSEVVPEAVKLLPEGIRDKLSIVQQVREADMAQTRKTYDDLDMDVEIQPFFEDLAGELSKAHLVICRSGASSVAEVTTAGRPAIFVPFPSHSDNQQKMNAKALVKKGGAWMFDQSDFTPQKLADKIEDLILDPEQLFSASETARDMAKPDAARKLGNLIVALVQGWETNKETKKT